MSDATLSKVERYYQRVEKPSTMFSLLEGRVLREAPGAKRDIVGIFYGVFLFVSLFAPIFGAAAIISSPDVGLWWNGLPIATAVIAAGACFAVSAVVLVVSIVDWFRRGRHRGSAGDYSYPIMTVISAAVTIVLMLPGYGEAAAWRLWGVPAWVAGGLSVVVILLLLLASRPRVEPQRVAEPKYPVDPATLSPEETARLLAIRGRVLDSFVERALMEPELAERAKQMPLGQLHLLDPE